MVEYVSAVVLKQQAVVLTFAANRREKSKIKASSLASSKVGKLGQVRGMATSCKYACCSAAVGMECTAVIEASSFITGIANAKEKKQTILMISYKHASAHVADAVPTSGSNTSISAPAKGKLSRSSSQC